MFVRKLRENKAWLLLPQFLQNTELFSECVFVVLPDVVNKREFTSGVVVIHILVWKIMFLPCVACSCD